jgi:hypothetical protein
VSKILATLVFEGGRLATLDDTDTWASADPALLEQVERYDRELAIEFRTRGAFAWWAGSAAGADLGALEVLFDPSIEEPDTPLRVW